MVQLALKIRTFVYYYTLRNKILLLSYLTLYLITFSVVLPWLCRDWPHSSFMSSTYSHDKLVSMVREKNEERSKSAINYLATLNAEETLSDYRKMFDVDKIDLIVGIITVMRSSPKYELNYLTQVMAQVDKLFKSDTSFSHKALFICNANAGPGIHQEAVRLARYFPLVTRFPNGSAYHVILDHFEKEKQDYQFCLEQAQWHHSSYILLIEDDALPHSDMFGAVKYFLDHRAERRTFPAVWLDSGQDWAYVKMFYPEKWQGYAREPELFVELIAIGILGGCASLTAMLLCQSSVERRRHLLVTRCLVFILGACYVMLCAVLIGRQNLLEFRRLAFGLYRIKTAPQCCTPAVLYQSFIVPDLISHLERTTCTKKAPVDLAIDQFATKHKLHRYILEPNLVKHIGYISTLKGPSRKPEFFI